MKFSLGSLRSALVRREDDDRRSPGYLFGGRVRTSTVVLVAAFVAVWWAYSTYRTDRPVPHTNEPPPAQVVPPGFVPDPQYTWVPRTQVQEPRKTTPTPTPTTTTTPTTPSIVPTTTEPAPPPFTLPTLPCLIPSLCPPTTSPAAPPPGG